MGYIIFQHMKACSLSEDSVLPYDMFITKIVKYFNVNLRNETDGYIGHNSKRSETNEGWKHLEVSLVDFDTLLNATNNIFSDNKLGDAGFRLIYKVRVYPTTIYKFLKRRTRIKRVKK
uniref:Uncharacterized protein n=1 Tax=Vitis vinifera TaxID=29760 RepID=F6HES2_VITVI